MSRCANPECQLPNCEGYSHDPQCCPRPQPHLAVDTCPVKVYVPDCTPSVTGTNLTGGVDCDCVPCPEDLAFTADQMAYIKTMLDGLLNTISPYARCNCEIANLIGHDNPLKPSQKTDETGAPIYLDSAGVETTDAVDADTGAANHPVFLACCDGNASIHSPFLTAGTSIYGRMGFNGVPPSVIADGDYNSIAFHENLGKLFCCAIEKLEEADVMVVAEAEEPVDTEEPDVEPAV